MKNLKYQLFGLAILMGVSGLQAMRPRAASHETVRMTPAEVSRAQLQARAHDAALRADEYTPDELAVLSAELEEAGLPMSSREDAASDKALEAAREIHKYNVAEYDAALNEYISLPELKDVDMHNRRLDSDLRQKEAEVSRNIEVFKGIGVAHDDPAIEYLKQKLADWKKDHAKKYVSPAQVVKAKNALQKAERRAKATAVHLGTITTANASRKTMLGGRGD